MQIKELLREINKRDIVNSPFNASIHLTNMYLSRFFNGTEHGLLRKEYADIIFMDVLEEVAKIYNYPNKKVNEEVFENAIWKARKYTFEYRRNCYITWLNNTIENNRNPVEDILTQSLLIFIKKLKWKNTVKELLGLNYKIEDINKKVWNVK